MSNQVEMFSEADVSGGFDPDTVRPAMSIEQAMTETIKHVVETHGWAEAKRRLPGLHTWNELSDDCKDRILRSQYRPCGQT